MERSSADGVTTDLNARLENWIEQRTGGRVHCLRVETIGGRVIVHGHSGSYYVRQLALAAVMEALDGSGIGLPQQVELDIDVGTAAVRSSPRCNCVVERSRVPLEGDKAAHDRDQKISSSASRK